VSNGYYNEYDSENLAGGGRQEESGSGLRALLEEALGKINTLQSELTSMKQASQPSVTELLESKGLTPEVAQIIPEGANAKEWLEQYGHLFGANNGEHLDEDESGELPPPEEVDPDLLREQEAWEAMHGVASGTTTRSVNDPFAQLEAATGEADILALIDAATRQQPGD
jgi:hypothetical protein